MKDYQMTKAELDENKLRHYLKYAVSLQYAMDVTLQTERELKAYERYNGFRDFAHKYVQILTLVASEIELPPVLDSYDIAAMPGPGHMLPYQRVSIFQGVYTNLNVLRAILESRIGIVEEESSTLRDFLQSRLRSAIFAIPEKESDVQNAIEQLFIGRGMQKGQDYDREVGRVKISAKEAVPDFIVAKLSLAIEVKLIKNKERVKQVVDEINADIPAYSKKYRQLLFLVYDLGWIRDVLEFRHDLEKAMNVDVMVIKH